MWFGEPHSLAHLPKCLCMSGFMSCQWPEANLNVRVWLEPAVLVHRRMSKPLIKASFTKCQPESNGLSCLWPPRLRPDAADSSLWSTSAQHRPGLFCPCCSRVYVRVSTSTSRLEKPNQTILATANWSESESVEVAATG